MIRILLFLFIGLLSGHAAERPNILWFIVDDMSANFACYGEKLVPTPNVDRLAREGVRFAKAHITAPVCSPCRSALITGRYQTSIGAHHHRSGRGKEKIELPAPIVPVPVLFQQAGYYTCIADGSVENQARRRAGKTDYNFEWDKKMYDGNDWSGRKEGQPFFMQVQLDGGKLRNGPPAAMQRLRTRTQEVFGAAVSPEAVQLPPYYPRDPVLLADWAAYLDAVRFTDRSVGQVLERLEKENLLANTLIVFMTDHGISHARGKQFLYEEGTHVPLVVRGPGVLAGVVREDLVEANIDLPALSLAAAGIEVPAWMHGRDILGKDYQPREATFAARDRCDETVEGMRSVRTSRWKYIRNFYPDRPHLQPNAYKDGKEIIVRLRQLHAEGKLPPLTEKLLFAPTRPQEELYDLEADKFEINNLAADPAHRATLVELRGKLDAWMEKTGDVGREPESASRYESDMAAASAGPAENKARLQNIELMKRWATERPMKVHVTPQ
jgi:arylsulfatase A-like enzyme